MTASAKEVIAAALYPIAPDEWHPDGMCEDCDHHRAKAAAILAALDAAGFVVVTAKDCRLITGDDAAIISRHVASAALSAIEARAKRGDYVNLFADDASLIRAAMDELRSAWAQESKP